MENSNKPDNQTTVPVVDTTQLLGQRFKQAREKLGLSIDEVAAKTFILKRHIEALETNNYEALPQPTFARGFATTYGRFLGLDNNLVTQSFDAQYPAQLKQKYATVINAPMQPMGTLNRESRGGIKINPFIIVGILVTLGLAIFIYNTVKKAHVDNQPETTASTTASSITPQDQATGASLNNAGSAIVTNTVTASGLPATGSAITGVVVNSASSTASSTTPTQATGNASIELWLKDKTTINITDASGKTLLQGEQARGGYNLTGQAPFNVNIDKVSNVSLDLNKQPIKLSTYANNDKANFTLKP